jgi:uncharacterized membrane protein YgcG
MSVSGGWYMAFERTTCRYIAAVRWVVRIGLVAVLATGWPAPAHAAQVGSERIVAYDVRLDVRRDGSLIVVETIDYDFGFVPRHGISRDVPVRFRYDGRHDRVYPISDIEVETSSGTPAGVKVTDQGAYKHIRIGDPDTTITGLHSYRITYRLRGAMNGFEGHDELYWNAIGDGWSVPIGRASVEVAMPTDITAVKCYTGPSGTQDLACSSAISRGATAQFTEDGMNPFDALTVVVAIPKGTVPEPAPILDERWSLDRAFARTPFTVTGSAVLAVVLIGGVALLLYRRGRDRRWAGSAIDAAFGGPTGEEEAVPLIGDSGVPVEFEPPDKLRPGQVGTLIDGTPHPLDVTATIVDLAVRGFLRIEETEEGGWFRKADWKLTKLDGGRGELLPYEQTLYDGLFKGRNEVQVSDLKNTFYKTVAKVREALYADAMGHGWFRGRPDKVRAVWVVLGVLALLTAIAAVVLLAVFTHLALLAVPAVIAAIVLLCGAAYMPSRTAKGTGVLRRTLGFKRFIDESERERAQFAEQKHLFTEYLPYAVVFGATEKWANAFAGIDGELPDTSSWYVGSHAFTIGSFNSSMSSFSSTTAGTIVSTPGSSGSSGFSGGGGSSGGGGGGGGGGSW